MRKKLFLTTAFVCLLISKMVLAQTGAIDSITSTVTATEAGAASTDTSVTTLSSVELAGKLNEAKSLLQSRAAEDSVSIALAALDPRADQIHVLTLAKEAFLTKGAEFSLTTNLGKTVRLRIIRPNGVNTAVTVNDLSGHSLLPLLVQYPIVRDGSWAENAYYTSAHPALVSNDVVSEGQKYLATMFGQAAAELQASGVAIPADIIQVAKHLVIVEHTDHKRFREEDRTEIYPEVLALYALNQGNTYRYSVSSAGAGGMIQMIPKTYAAIRGNHPNVRLESDFVSGMQNHANALKAMLLYINDTWNFLDRSETVQQALTSGVATKTELLAAGYNSNPYRLPDYLSSGGSAWKNLIPEETQMYLAIYQSVDSHVDFQQNVSVPNSDVGSTLAPGGSITRQATSALMSWISRQVVQSGAAALSLLR
jgi:hypothetical protein